MCTRASSQMPDWGCWGVFTESRGAYRPIVMGAVRLLCFDRTKDCPDTPSVSGPLGLLPLCASGGSQACVTSCSGSPRRLVRSDQGDRSRGTVYASSRSAGVTRDLFLAAPTQSLIDSLRKGPHYGGLPCFRLLPIRSSSALPRLENRSLSRRAMGRRPCLSTLVTPGPQRLVDSRANEARSSPAVATTLGPVLTGVIARQTRQAIRRTFPARPSRIRLGS